MYIDRGFNNTLVILNKKDQQDTTEQIQITSHSKLMKLYLIHTNQIIHKQYTTQEHSLIKTKSFP